MYSLQRCTPQGRQSVQHELQLCGKRLGRAMSREVQDLFIIKVKMLTPGTFGHPPAGDIKGGDGIKAKMLAVCCFTTVTYTSHIPPTQKLALKCEIMFIGIQVKQGCL